MSEAVRSFCKIVDVSNFALAKPKGMGLMEYIAKVVKENEGYIKEQTLSDSITVSIPADDVLRDKTLIAITITKRN